ncbi:MAG: hypothetical protein CME32_23835 [Gimesia sp.]|uniref:Uncharacterized protein n=1 Tax=Gimesia chilikensis TaxID=2605989 RepID=A0A517PIG8_9PLAN|nr:hypothetical protein [Gimesia chilikensis]MBN72298.1 hypothetical protein [Gimesia sp.]MCR9231199.1 hypothetical protein [bacterium]QDT19182.1 hypothetical protein HG66A1_09460 [Gimesia chilikensis]
MFRSKIMISLCILLGTGLGCFLAHEYWTNHLQEWQEKPVIDTRHQSICFWVIYASALLATLVASWKERTSLWLSLIGITVGWFIFSLLAGPAYSFSPTATQQGLLPAEVIREQLNRQTFGMLLGAFLFLYWPEIGRFLNSLNGKDSAALTAPRSPSESHGSS